MRHERHDATDATKEEREDLGVKPERAVGLHFAARQDTPLPFLDSLMYDLRSGRPISTIPPARADRPPRTSRRRAGRRRGSSGLSSSWSPRRHGPRVSRTRRSAHTPRPPASCQAPTLVARAAWETDPRSAARRWGSGRNALHDATVLVSRTGWTFRPGSPDQLRRRAGISARGNTTIAADEARSGLTPVFLSFLSWRRGVVASWRKFSDVESQRLSPGACSSR